MRRFPALGVGFLIRTVLLIAAATVLLALPSSAHAAYPGANGKIAFSWGSTEPYPTPAPGLYTINEDGTGLQSLRACYVGYDNFCSGSAWSPDGKKLAFDEIADDDRDGDPCCPDVYVTNADGSGTVDLTPGRSAPPNWGCGEGGPCSPSDYDPTWSPDGAQVAFSSDRDSASSCYLGGCNSDIYKMNADGTATTRLTTTQGGANRAIEPAWSPDGTKIAFTRITYVSGSSSDYDVYAMNADGTNQTNLTPGGVPGTRDADPAWSPDGKKIYFSSNRDGPDPTTAPYHLYVMNTDGTNQTILSGGSAGGDYAPAPSPDGTKVAFVHTCSGCNPTIYTANTDGTNRLPVTDGTRYATWPDWQPINPAPYARPVGASPLELAFVQAYRPCETTSANARHGTPLNFPSCSNPTPASSTVRTGPNTLSIARIVVCPSNASSTFCNPMAGMPKPDVRLTGSIRDVRCQGTVPAGCTPGGDYSPNNAPGPYTDAGNGKGGAQPPCFPSGTSSTACLAGADLTEVAELPGASLGGSGTQFEGRGVRITDRQNGISGSDAATVIDIGFPVPLDCLPTASTIQGSTCGVNTTANALAPGVVTNGKAAVWQIGQLELRDSGPDGLRGNSDDELFAVQGVFLP